MKVRPWKSIAYISLALLFVSLLASCRGGVETPAPGFPVQESSEAADAQQTAAWLDDPELAEQGVLSLLKNLGIGVYSQEAVQIFPGSERGPEDFFLFDFQVGLLMRGAGGKPIPFSDYHARLAMAGLELSEQQLLSFYRETYAARPDEWLVQLFDSMGLEFEGEVTLTPLQEWLLFVDTFVPPNGHETTAAAPKARMATLRFVPSKEEGPCDAVRGSNADSAWGLAWSAGGAASDALEGAVYGPASLLDPKDIAHAIMMSMGVETKLTASASSAHEGHDGSGVPITFTVSVEFTGDLPQEIVSCAAVMGFEVPPKGPMEGVRVEWSLDDVIAQHGRTTRGGGVMFTDSSGKSEVVWTPRAEPSGGEGEEYVLPGTAEVVIRIQHGDVFNLFAGAQEFLAPRTETAEIKVGWHESSWILIMSLDAKIGEVPPINFTWDGLFVVDDEFRIDGEGTVTVTGTTGPCLVHENDRLVHEGPPGNVDGSFPFTIGGRQELKIHAQVFDFEIESPDASTTIAPKDEMCGFLYSLVEELIAVIAEDIQDMAPMGLIEIEAKDGKTTTINIPEIGVLTVTVLSSRG
ncbi:MAG: hypothetical protein WBB65_00995 [Anaerolineales bacterium]